MHFWARGTSSFTLACLVLMHVEKLISSLLVAIPSPGESSLLQLPGPMSMQGPQKHIVRVSFPPSDDPLLAVALPSLISFFSSSHVSIRRRTMCLSMVPHQFIPGYQGSVQQLRGISTSGSCTVWSCLTHQRTASMMLIALSSGHAHAAGISLSITLNGAALGLLSTAGQHLSCLR